MGDNEIIEKIRRGDNSAVDELYSKYAGQAVRTAYLICSDIHGAQDIFQESFIQCLKSLHSLKDPSSFKSWFYRILTRQAWRYIKKNRPCVPVEEIYENADFSSSDEYFADQKYDTLYSAIKSLNDKQRTAIILFYFNEMSVKDISRAMSCSEGTVKSRLFTAKSRLKKIIGKEELK